MVINQPVDSRVKLSVDWLMAGAKSEEDGSNKFINKIFSVDANSALSHCDFRVRGIVQDEAIVPWEQGCVRSNKNFFKRFLFNFPLDTSQNQKLCSMDNFKAWVKLIRTCMHLSHSIDSFKFHLLQHSSLQIHDDVHHIRRPQRYGELLCGCGHCDGQAKGREVRWSSIVLDSLRYFEVKMVPWTDFY